MFDALEDTDPFNAFSHPAASVPCGTVDGLPVGLQFAASCGDAATAVRYES